MKVSAPVTPPDHRDNIGTLSRLLESTTRRWAESTPKQGAERPRIICNNNNDNDNDNIIIIFIIIIIIIIIINNTNSNTSNNSNSNSSYACYV